MKLIEKIRYQIGIETVFDLLNIEEGMLGYKCPFCNEQVGAVMLKETENRFKCTSCMKTGGSVDLVKHIQNLELDEAVNYLAKKFNIEEDSDFEEDLLSSWKQDSEKNNPSINDFFGIEEDEETIDDLIIYEEIFNNCDFDETTDSYLKLKGFSNDLINLLKIKTLNNPHIFYENFAQKYSKKNIDRAGLLDRNREFIFQKNNVLVPFFHKDLLSFLGGWNIGGGKLEFLFPHKKTIPDYFPNLYPQNNNLYIVEDLRGVFAFLKKGFNAIAIYNTISQNILEIISKKNISVCGEKNENGNKFNRKIIKQLTESNIDFTIHDFSPCFEDYGEYLMEKRK